MKKSVFILLAVLLLAGALSVTVYARGGHGRGKRTGAQPRYPLCTAAACEDAGLHRHDGQWYCAQPGSPCGYGEYSGCQNGRAARGGCARGWNR